MNRCKVTTCTTLVAEALRTADDFLSVRDLVKQTACQVDQVRAALSHLKQHHVVDLVGQSNGETFWFLLPPTEDDRHRVVAERAVELKPRRPRRKKGRTL